MTQGCAPWPGLTSACPPGDRTLWQRSHFRQKRCQFLPRELTFSAVGDRVEPGCGKPGHAAGAPFSFLSPTPLLPRDDGECPRDVSSNPPECPAPQSWKGGLSSSNAPAHTRPISPSSARASPKKTGCWQRGQVQLMAPHRAAGATHSRHHRRGLRSRPLRWLRP